MNSHKELTDANIMNMYERAMARAYEAATKSPDPSNQNGACMLTPWGNIIETGYNHFYEGIPVELEDREKKLAGIEHAERDCIFQTGRTYGTLGCTLVCPWSTCNECARAIIGSGIDMLIVHKERQDHTPERWKANVDEALMWIDYKCRVIELCGPVVGSPSIIVNGRLWSPERLEFDD